MTERAEEASDKPATHNCGAGWQMRAHSGTWSPARQNPLPLSVSPLCASASTHVTQPQRNSSCVGEGPKTSGGEENSRERWCCLVPLAQNGRELGSCVQAQRSDTQVQAHTNYFTHAYINRLCLRHTAALCTNQGALRTSPTFFHAINENRHCTVSLHFARIWGALENTSFYERSNFPTEFPPN